MVLFLNCVFGFRKQFLRPAFYAPTETSYRPLTETLKNFYIVNLSLARQVPRYILDV